MNAMEESIDAVLAALDDADEYVRLGAVKVLTEADRCLLREAGASLIPRSIGKAANYCGRFERSNSIANIQPVC